MKPGIKATSSDLWVGSQLLGFCVRFDHSLLIFLWQCLHKLNNTKCCCVFASLLKELLTFVAPSMTKFFCAQPLLLFTCDVNKTWRNDNQQVLQRILSRFHVNLTFEKTITLCQNVVVDAQLSYISIATFTLQSLKPMHIVWVLRSSSFIYDLMLLCSSVLQLWRTWCVTF